MLNSTVRTLVLVLAALAPLGCSRSESPAVPAAPAPTVAPPEPLAFVGSDGCAGCHAAETSAWRESHHARATAAPAANNGLAPTSGAARPARGSGRGAWAAPPDSKGTPGLTAPRRERRGVPWARKPGTGIAERSAPRDTVQEFEGCAQGPSRRAQVAEGCRAGSPLLE